MNEQGHPFWVSVLIHVPLLIFTMLQILNVSIHIVQGDFVREFSQYESRVLLLPTPVGISGAITLWCNRLSHRTPQTSRLFKRHAIVCLVFLGWFAIAALDLMIHV